MAKINRFNGNLKAFASESTGTNRTLFGEVTQADDLTSQVTADFKLGWQIVGPSDQPSLQDFNAAMYTHGQLLAYLHQAGVPEYHPDQEFFIGSVTQYDGIIYISSNADNTGNQPDVSPSNWVDPLALKANQATTYTETEVDSLLDYKADIAGQIFTGEIFYRGAGSASNNTSYGQGALSNNTTGSRNTANGQGALSFNTTGGQNTANGQDALNANTAGSQNTANGQAALINNTTGGQNTANGQASLSNNTIGGNNTANGQAALINNTTGNNNTAIGQDALNANTTGNGNTSITPRSSSGSYSPVFDPITQNDRFCMGSTSVTNAYIQVAWTVVSDARDKTNFSPIPHGLDFVKSLLPTSYQFRVGRDSEETNGPVRYGFKAQDVLALEGENPVIVDNEDVDKLRMIDTALIPVLVKALQDLDAKFEAYVSSHP